MCLKLYVSLTNKYIIPSFYKTSWNSCDYDHMNQIEDFSDLALNLSLHNTNNRKCKK